MSITIPNLKRVYCTVVENRDNWHWNYRNLEICVKGHSRLLEMAPFDRPHTSS